MMIDGLQCEDVETCALCGVPGVWLYRGLRDHLFGAPGRWNFSRCPECGLVWLNPRPSPQELGKVYASYFTHSRAEPAPSARGLSATLRRRIQHGILAVSFGYDPQTFSKADIRAGRLTGWMRFLRMRIGYQVLWLRRRNHGRLLDVGCGDGSFMSFMRQLGWEVAGLEPDPEAARIAGQRLGLEVGTRSVSEAVFPAASFDAIVLRHVFEHLPDPVRVLEKCRTWLKPDGRLAVLTPNSGSWGHRRFLSAWRGLEPPRHFYLFSPKTLEMSARRIGLDIEGLWTIATGAKFYFEMSRHLERSAAPDSGPGKPNWLSRLERGLFYWAEELIVPWVRVGEEAVLIASKKSRPERRPDKTPGNSLCLRSKVK